MSMDTVVDNPMVLRFKSVFSRLRSPSDEWLVSNRDLLARFMNFHVMHVLAVHPIGSPLSADFVSKTSELLNSFLYEEKLCQWSREKHGLGELSRVDRKLVELAKDMLAICLAMLQFEHLKTTHPEKFISMDEFMFAYGETEDFVGHLKSEEKSLLLLFRNYSVAYFEIPLYQYADQKQMNIRQVMFVAAALSHGSIYRKAKPTKRSPFVDRIWYSTGSGAGPETRRRKAICSREADFVPLKRKRLDDDNLSLESQQQGHSPIIQASDWISLGKSLGGEPDFGDADVKDDTTVESLSMEEELCLE